MQSLSLIIIQVMVVPSVISLHATTYLYLHSDLVLSLSKYFPFNTFPGQWGIWNGQQERNVIFVDSIPQLVLCRNSDIIWVGVSESSQICLVILHWLYSQMFTIESWDEAVSKYMQILHLALFKKLPETMATTKSDIGLTMQVEKVSSIHACPH